ncbi:hypothetical protein PG994_003044 [Apiospora phragmitis]|uniref:Uncharacterized protein n=1 Tax=Apiospora phragmitis TaxID=2905665 RepID=A0ABR1W860_9PEZI
MQEIQICYIVDAFFGARPSTGPVAILPGNESNPTVPIYTVRDTRHRFQLTMETRTSLSTRFHSPHSTDPLCVVRGPGQIPFGHINVRLFLTELRPNTAKDFEGTATVNKNHYITLVTELAHGHLNTDLDTMRNRDWDSLALDAKSLSNHDNLKFNIVEDGSDFITQVKIALVRLFARNAGIEPEPEGERLSDLYACLDKLTEFLYIDVLRVALEELQSIFVAAHDKCQGRMKVAAPESLEFR